MKYFTIQIEEEGNRLYTKNPANEKWLFTEAEDGDCFIIKCIEMSQNELDNLPEFIGF
uniref:Uncharacterized protein n=1 Tax=viral metagenome TaxID=1070528 RepID=A0A6M3JRV4_9ZZZZ